MLAAGVPASPIYDISQVAADEHIAKVREMFVEMEHPKAGRLRVTGNQIKFSENPVQIRVPSPLLGQHNEEIYCDALGLSREEYEDYVSRGII